MIDSLEEFSMLGIIAFTKLIGTTSRTDSELLS